LEVGEKKKMVYGKGGLERVGEDLHERTENWKNTLEAMKDRILFRDGKGFAAGDNTILGTHRDKAHAITKKTVDSMKIKESAALRKLKDLVKRKSY